MLRVAPTLRCVCPFELGVLYEHSFGFPIFAVASHVYQILLNHLFLIAVAGSEVGNIILHDVP